METEQIIFTLIKEVEVVTKDNQVLTLTAVVMDSFVFDLYYLVSICYAQNRLFEIIHSNQFGYHCSHILCEYCVMPELDDILAEDQQNKYEATIK